MRWLVLIFVSGCFAPSVPVGASCTGDGRCPSGQVCVDSVCRELAVLPDGGKSDNIAVLDDGAVAFLDGSVDGGVGFDATPSADAHPDEGRACDILDDDCPAQFGCYWNEDGRNGVCLPEGSGFLNDLCNPNQGERCVPGLLCGGVITGRITKNDGLCKVACDPVPASDPRCETGQSCNPTTPEIGVCF